MHCQIVRQVFVGTLQSIANDEKSDGEIEEETCRMQKMHC